MHQNQILYQELKEKILCIPGKIRKEKPLVHMIPNSVTVTFCTDGLAAVGARPLMAKAPQEMEEIVSYADALVINLGQPDEEKRRAAMPAIQKASEKQTPIVLDPVGAGASGYRKKISEELLSLNWKGIIKGNRSEIAALQRDILNYQGVDAVGDTVISCRAEDNRIWSVSGEKDLVFDAGRNILLPHREGKKLTLSGSGCLTGALMGACYAVEKDAFAAAAAAFVMMNDALGKAGRYKGYASQKNAVLDALSEIKENELEEIWEYAEVE